METDAYGRAVAGGYHDGTIVRLNISDSDIEIVLRNDSGKNVEIEILDCLDYTIDGMWMGSIVNEIYYLHLSRIDAYADNSGAAAIGLFCSGRYVSSEYEGVLRKFLNMNAASILLQIVCSYGGTLSFVCRAAAFRDVPAT